MSNQQQKINAIINEFNTFQVNDMENKPTITSILSRILDEAKVCYNNKKFMSHDRKSTLLHLAYWGTTIDANFNIKPIKDQTLGNFLGYTCFEAHLNVFRLLVRECSRLTLLSFQEAAQLEKETVNVLHTISNAFIVA